ncbi:MAG: bifunctional oligoribonuclease/PAP phosphatase NrnA [Lentisphaeria bacterium]|nr:bifunctional oligoribonuclease/PAP phosphatase NrnA [Lentisphaeria bacterium]
MSGKRLFPCIGELAAFLKEKRGEGKILLLAHERPDGDAVGALCGFREILRDNGFQAEYLLPEAVPDMYKTFLRDSCPGTITEKDLAEYSLLLFLDCSNQKRCSVPFLREGPLPLPSLNIDHHPDNTSFADGNYFASTAAATCEILFSLAEEAEFSVRKYAATCLLLGIITDCGCFRYDNTAPSTLRAAARLMELGADRGKIVEACYMTKPEGLALLEGELLCRHLKKSENGRFAYVCLAPELLEKYGVDLRNTEQLIDALRQLEGVKACAVLRREKECFKASLRSKDPAVSAGRIARALGGGGHEMAAGCSLSVSTFEEAEKALLAAVEEEFRHEERKEK